MAVTTTLTFQYARQTRTTPAGSEVTGKHSRVDDPLQRQCPRVSFGPYFMIVHPVKYTKIYTPVNTAVIITGSQIPAPSTAFSPAPVGIAVIGLYVSDAGVWVFSIGCSLPPLFGWAKYSFMADQSFCFCSWADHPGYTVFMFTMGFCLPSTAMTGCYVGIWRRYKKNRRKLGGSPTRNQRRQSREATLDKSVTSLTPKSTSRCSIRSPQQSSHETTNPPKTTQTVVFFNNHERSTCWYSTRQGNDNTDTTREGNANGCPADDMSKDRQSDGCSEVAISCDSSSDRKNSGDRKPIGTKPRAIENEVSPLNEKKSARPNRKHGAVAFDCDLTITVNSPRDDEVPAGDRADEDDSEMAANSCDRHRNRLRNRIKKRQRKEEAALTRSLLVVILVFMVCWSPYAITTMGQVIGSMYVPRAVKVVSLVLGYFNSCCNPLVYGLMNKRFRDGFARLFRLNCGRNAT
ncbi:hypothetical protein Bbelb_171880 [Branchiostoma belcheri]|nr:hypothetical protein Bbelb_171880 [Branchiostoma belcheri]